jgi:hypothetical protein
MGHPQWEWCTQISLKADQLPRCSLPWELEEIADLFCDEVLASVKRSIDVLKLERQRLVLPKPWA